MDYDWLLTILWHGKNKSKMQSLGAYFIYWFKEILLLQKYCENLSFFSKRLKLLKGIKIHLETCVKMCLGKYLTLLGLKVDWNKIGLIAVVVRLCFGVLH